MLLHRSDQTQSSVSTEYIISALGAAPLAGWCTEGCNWPAKSSQGFIQKITYKGAITAILTLRGGS